MTHINILLSGLSLLLGLNCDTSACFLTAPYKEKTEVDKTAFCQAKFEYAKKVVPP